MRFNRLHAGLLAASIAVTGGLEGMRLVAYQDSGGIWTACYGETLGIKHGDQFTKAQCDAMFGKSLQKHNTPLEDISHQLPPHVHLASLDMAYNIGTDSFKRSTLYHYLLNGTIQTRVWKYHAGDM